MTLYLSRLLLDAHSRRVAGEIAHPYEMHRTLMRAFPSVGDVAGAARHDFGILFRAECEEPRGTVTVYVQSGAEPYWQALNGLDGYLLSVGGTPAWECKEITRSLQGISQGQVLAFRLRANPTKRVNRDVDPLKGKRVELQREEEQLEWLAAKGRGGRDGVPGGFELVMNPTKDGEGEQTLVPCVEACREGKVTGTKRDASGAYIMTHAAVVFDGLLRVTEVGPFLDTLRAGIGSGKAYGFGLLSLARPGASSLEHGR